MRDTIVDNVIQQFDKRSKKGVEKYGTTLERNDIDLLGWVQHLQEELMDAILYVERIKHEFETVSKENANAMKIPKDKNGREIKPGDVIRLTFNVRKRERPDHRRVGIDSMGVGYSIWKDEGKLLDPITHWVDFVVKWKGACLIAERIGASDFSEIIANECFDVETGKEVYDAHSHFHYINESFNGKLYEVHPERIKHDIQNQTQARQCSQVPTSGFQELRRSAECPSALHASSDEALERDSKREHYPTNRNSQVFGAFDPVC